MNYQVLQFVLLFCIDFVLYYDMTLLLTMRSLKVFYGGSLILFILSYVMRGPGAPLLLRSFIAGLCYCFYPLLCSKGPLRRRITTILLMNFIMVCTELLGSIFYSAIASGMVPPESIDAATAIPVTITYIVITSAAAFMFQIVASTVEYLEDKLTFQISLPVLAFMAIPVLVHVYAYVWIYLYLRASSMMSIYFQAADTLLCFAVTQGLFRIVQQDNAARRMLAQHHAAKQQLAVLKRQVSKSVQQNNAMKQLRHDLANQISVVQELASEGRLKEADAHLVALQQRAEALGETL